MLHCVNKHKIILVNNMQADTHTHTTVLQEILWINGSRQAVHHGFALSQEMYLPTYALHKHLATLLMLCVNYLQRLNIQWIVGMEAEWPHSLPNLCDGRNVIFTGKHEALRERKPPPRMLTLWAVFTLKGIVMYFVYVHFVSFVF